MKQSAARCRGIRHNLWTAGGALWRAGATVLALAALAANGLAQTPGTVKWIFPPEGGWGPGFYSSPALGTNGLVYIGSKDRNVYAIDSDTGLERWSFTTGGQVWSSPTIGPDGTVYTGSYDKKLYALDGETGDKRWEFQATGQIFAGPVIAANGTVYMVSEWGVGLYALDAANGHLRWKLAGERIERPALGVGADGTVFVAWGESILALDGETGERLWAHKVLRQYPVAAPALGADGTLYFSSSDYSKGMIFALDWRTGERRWEFPVQAGVIESSPAIGTDGAVFVGICAAGTNAFSFLALDGQTGEVRWASALPPQGCVLSSPALANDGTVFFGSSDFGEAGLFALNAVTGEGVRVAALPKTVRFSSSPAIGPDGTVYIGDSYGSLYAYYGSAPLADSPWPMRGGNPQHTGSAEFDGEPRILDGLADLEVPRSGVARLGALVGGSRPAVFQWFKGDALVTNSIRVHGAATARLAVGALRAEDAGAYTLVVSNAFGMVTSRTAVVTLREPVLGEKLWEYADDRQVNSLVVGTNGACFAGTTDGRVIAFQRATGRTLWTHSTGVAGVQPLSVTPDGTVLTSAARGTISALDPDSGGLRWQTDLGPSLSGLAIGHQGLVYAKATNVLYALDGATGQIQWQAPCASANPAVLAVGPDGTVYLSGNGFLVAVEGSSGTPRGQFVANGYDVLQAVGTDGTVFVWVPPSQTNTLYGLRALDGDHGAVRWVASPFGKIALGEDGTVFTSDFGRPRALDPASGAYRWQGQAQLSGTGLGHPAVLADGTVLYPAETNLFALNGTTGDLKWEVNLGTDRSKPGLVASDGMAYLWQGTKVMALYCGSPSAASAWAMYGGDAQGSRRVPWGPRPRLNWTRTAAGLRLEWPADAALQWTEARAPLDWRELADATSPLEVALADTPRLYRLRRK